MERLLAIALSLQLTVTTVPSAAQQMGTAQQTGTTGSAQYPGQAAPLSANDLEKLAAPIALYPDALVAQILGAATFPDQLVDANLWLLNNSGLKGAALTQTVDMQPWEPSVKALTQFPSVLANMAGNLSWTSALGEAYHTQPADVMHAIQVLRAKATAAGNLKSGGQITVVQQSPDVIVIQPTNPQVIYVPAYNPTVVYGVPYVTPGYSTAAVVTTGVLAFGAGIAVGAAMSSTWGYSTWNCNWHGGTVVYGSTTYYGNNAWHGGYYGSSATAYGPNGTAHVSSGYNPSTGTYARSESTTTPYGSQKASQAYNPNTGNYAATHQTSNAYGSYGSSVATHNGETTYSQHETTAQGSVGSVQNSSGGKAAGVDTAHGNAAVGETSSGTKYAASNGNVYKDSGSGWQQTQKSTESTSRGWGGEEKSSGSAYGGSSSGWQSRAESSRGSSSLRGGGGWRR